VLYLYIQNSKLENQKSLTVFTDKDTLYADFNPEVKCLVLNTAVI